LECLARGNRSTRKKPAPVPLSPPQIPHDLTRAWIRAAVLGTALAMTRPTLTLEHFLYVGPFVRINDVLIRSISLSCFIASISVNLWLKRNVLLSPWKGETNCYATELQELAVRCLVLNTCMAVIIGSRMNQEPRVFWTCLALSFLPISVRVPNNEKCKKHLRVLLHLTRLLSSLPSPHTLLHRYHFALTSSIYLSSSCLPPSLTWRDSVSLCLFISTFFLTRAFS
jgi:hypothetical protein